MANYTGNYSSARNYGLHDAVSYGGSTYISLVAGNVGQTPDVSPAYWVLLAAQVGIAGSSKLGNYVVLAGQVGVAGHLKIGNQVTVGAKSGVMHNIPDGEKWLWIPAQPIGNVKRQVVALPRLPDLLKRVAELEKKMGGK